MPTKTKRSTKRPSSKRRIGQRGFARLAQPLKFRNKRGLAIVGLVVAVGIAALGFTMAADTTYSIWSNQTTPRNVADPDGQAVEVGMKFKATQAGSVTGVKFYKSRTNTGTHTGNLWSQDGALLARATFVGETVSGWQTVKFSQPVPILANTTYVVSYHAPKGHYSGDNGYFTKARTNGPLVALASSTSSPNGVYQYSASSSFPTSSYRSTNYWVDVLFQTNAPDPTVTPTPIATPTPTPVATPTPTPGPVTTTPTPTPAPAGSWPNASNTGVPASATLPNYTGPCTITAAGTVIDGKAVNCDLVIAASGVTIKNSRVTGHIDADSSSASVTVVDTTVIAGSTTAAAIGYSNLTVLRANITGGQHSINCAGNCDIRDSYLHNQYVQGATHNNAFISNGGSNMMVVHNTLFCEPANNSSGGGCSGDVSLFGDFAAVTDVTIDGNLLMANPGISYCLYAGYGSAKPYGTQTRNIKVTNNTFQRGANRQCGGYGPLTDYTLNGGSGSAAPGNVWTNNKWDDGTILNP